MGMLYVIPTPVGNLEDITMRAVRLLKEADFVLAEDTRTSSKLLKHLEIQVPMYSHHKFNEHKTSASLECLKALRSLPRRSVLNVRLLLYARYPNCTKSVCAELLQNLWSILRRMSHEGNSCCL